MTRQDELVDLYTRVVDGFDGSEYQQGKKDGLRIAIAILGLNVPLPESALELSGLRIKEFLRRRIESE